MSIHANLEGWPLLFQRSEHWAAQCLLSEATLLRVERTHIVSMSWHKSGREGRPWWFCKPWFPKPWLQIPDQAKKRLKYQGQIPAQGTLHRWNANLGPNAAKQILDDRILDPNFWVDFFDSVLLSKRGPKKITFGKLTSQNSPSKSQPGNRAKKFTLHLCRAVWLIK